MFIRRELDDAFPGFNGNRNNLRCEDSILQSLRRACLALERESILFFASDPALFGKILRGNAHRIRENGIGQTFAQDAVDQFARAISISGECLRKKIGCARNAFSATKSQCARRQDDEFRYIFSRLCRNGRWVSSR